MAFDPRREDYQRLGLRFARTLDSEDPFGAARAISSFSRRFVQNRDSLPQSDGDRAFHLVAEATDLIDYQLPFAADEACQSLLDNAERLLGEALDLDPKCHDARRMMAAASCPSFESYYRYLANGADEVRRDCERIANEASTEYYSGQHDLARDIAMRPYLRWLATEAGKALICGRYTRTIQLSRDLLGLNPADPCDVRFTAALAFAKLEDETGLDALVTRCRHISRPRPDKDAWLLIARLAIAYKQHDLEVARGWLDELLAAYPHAAATLTRQDELPDGVFSRLAVSPFSEDEMILAVSEGTVLLQEGRDESDHGVLGSWLASEPSVVRATAADSHADPSPSPKRGV